MNGESPEVIMTFTNRVAAETAASRLQSNDIEAHVWADDVGGAYPQLGPSLGVRLVVPARDVERALSILGGFEEGGARKNSYTEECHDD